MNSETRSKVINLPLFSRSGVFVITLTANNGAGPVVAMETIQVDDPITSLQLQYEPVDPAIGEGMIFIVTTDDDSKGIDVSFYLQVASILYLF